MTTTTEEPATRPEKVRAEKSSPLRRPSLPSSKPIAALAILVLIATTVVFAALYLTKADDAAPASGPTSQMRVDAMNRAKEYGVALASFDYNNLDKNRAAITAMSTSDFAKKYDEMVKQLGPVVTSGKGVATAKAVAAGVSSISDSAATVLVFVDQQASNVASPQGKLQPYRLLVSLQRANNAWVVSDVQSK